MAAMCPDTGNGTDGDVNPVQTGRLGEGCQKTTAQGERQGSFNPAPDDLVWGVHTEKMYGLRRPKKQGSEDDWTAGRDDTLRPGVMRWMRQSR